MQDYIPQDPNRKKMTHGDGTIEYVHIELADNPTANNPTPLNKGTLLDDDTAAALGLPNTATPNQALRVLDGKAKKLDAAIAGKADKMVPGSAGNLAALDTSGNLADAGKKPGDFSAAKHTHSRGDISNFSHTHSTGDIASGVLPIVRGGTGGNTADSALNALGATRIGFISYVGNSQSMREVSVGHYMKWAYLCLSTGATRYQNNPVEDSIIHGGLLSEDYPLVTGRGFVCAQLWATSLRLFANDSCSGVNMGNGSNARYEYYLLYGY